ncbi:esterase [Sphingobium lactosutens]|nr:SGNH/GDSL hydrolase family protein [Sphingobium lactosutens]NWK94571.1 esterase [Sphingobium lactosutens]
MLGCVAALQAEPSHAQYWAGSWAAAPQAPLSGNSRPIPDLTDRTIRQVVRISSGGKQVRIRLSNEMSDTALRLDSVRIAYADAAGRIVPGSDRVVTFDGRADVQIPGHAPMISDPVALAVQRLSRLAISLHFREPVVRPTIHSHAASTAWIAPGDQTSAPSMEASAPFMQRLVISGVEVENRRAVNTIVTFGDSITDGALASIDSDQRWPDLLAQKLQAGGKRPGVANLGLGGNRLLADGTGLNALARFDRDVLAVPGVSHVIIMEGVNDIGTATRDKLPLPTAQVLTAAIRQLITRAHGHGVKAILATILPYKGAGYWSEEGEQVRQAVNLWIRTSGQGDGFIDFDKALADKSDAAHIAAAFDGGDHLHPNDAGFRAMADAIDLKLLK